jgi:hypothetical protein
LGRAHFLFLFPRDGPPAISPHWAPLHARTTPLLPRCSTRSCHTRGMSPEPSSPTLYLTTRCIARTLTPFLSSACHHRAGPYTYFSSALGSKCRQALPPRRFCHFEQNPATRSALLLLRTLLDHLSKPHHWSIAPHCGFWLEMSPSSLLR